MFEWLHTKGTAHMLVKLLEEDHYVSWFYKSEHNPKGLGSSTTVIKVRNLLLSMDLISEYRVKIRPRLYLRLTEKGIQVAEHLKAIQDLLTNP